MVSITTCDSGDWIIVNVENKSGKHKEWRGHSISEYDWSEILKFLGIAVTSENVSDEEMELM